MALDLSMNSPIAPFIHGFIVEGEGLPFLIHSRIINSHHSLLTVTNSHHSLLTSVIPCLVSRAMSILIQTVTHLCTHMHTCMRAPTHTHTHAHTQLHTHTHFSLFSLSTEDCRPSPKSSDVSSPNTINSLLSNCIKSTYPTPNNQGTSWT